MSRSKWKALKNIYIYIWISTFLRLLFLFKYLSFLFSFLLSGKDIGIIYKTKLMFLPCILFFERFSKFTSFHWSRLSRGMLGI